MIWVDTNYTWPGSDLPASLATLSFTTPSKEALIDDVTGQAIPLNINYTSGQKLLGYDFVGESTSLVQEVFNLDVDGNGEVGAFSDGFMVLRKMFGDAFAGDALTNKAISSSSPYYDNDNAW